MSRDRDTVLDDLQPTYDFNDHLEKDETIIWSDVPHPAFVIATLESTALTGVAVMLSFGILICFILSWGPIILILMTLAILLIIRPEIVALLHRRKTRYALTNKRLFFKIWTIYGTQIKSMRLVDINQVTIDVKANNIGTLYFMPKSNSAFYKKSWLSIEKPRFVTKEVTTGIRRQYPTFEFILEARAIRAMISEQHQLAIEANRKSVLDLKELSNEDQVLPLKEEITLERKPSEGSD